MRLARRNFANSTLDNPVFAVMELHRFEVYINDGCEDAEIELGGPAEKFDNVFDSDYLCTPKAGPEDSLQRIAVSEVFNAEGHRDKCWHMVPSLNKWTLKHLNYERIALLLSVIDKSGQ